MSKLPPQKSLGRKSLWIPGLIVGGFVLLFVIEGNLVGIAVRNRSELVTQNPYLQGINFNQTLAEAAREKALGWKISIGFAQTSPLHGMVSVGVADRDGNPLMADFDVTAERATDQYQSLPLKLVAGQAALAVNLPGRWFIKVIARRGGDHAERIQEICVDPCRPSDPTQDSGL